MAILVCSVTLLACHLVVLVHPCAVVIYPIAMLVSPGGVLVYLFDSLGSLDLILECCLTVLVCSCKSWGVFVLVLVCLVLPGNVPL